MRDGSRLQRELFLPPDNQFEHSMQNGGILIEVFLPPKPDSTCHSLFFCELIKRLWKDTEYYQVMKVAKEACTMDFCWWMSEQLSRGEFEKFAIQTWAIWKEKLDIFHGNDRPLNELNITWSRAFLSEFQDDRLADRTTTKKHSSVKKWKKPEKTDLKLNVDACVNENLNRYSVSGVLRDNQGRLLLAFDKQIPKPILVLMGELEAIKEGINILYDKQFHDVQVTIDPFLAVQAVTNFKEDISYAGLRVSEIIDLIQEPIVSDFIHENRLANNVAHNIAHFSSYYHSSFVWMNGEFLSWLVPVYAKDVKLLWFGLHSTSVS
ncbi:uncharacterized protein [Primulina huaijiensis]|uniref:uncharacterized protein n=1 Tax=Primulina huaijiensis TaxID=1492673 RepID=UPI003CC70497